MKSFSENLEVFSGKMDMFSKKKEVFFYLSLHRATVYIPSERDWLPLAPEKGRFLGWQKYGAGFEFATPRQREAFVFSQISDDLEG